MLIHTFGSNNGKAVLLLHGMLTPWQIWNEAIACFEPKRWLEEVLNWLASAN